MPELSISKAEEISFSYVSQKRKEAKDITVTTVTRLAHGIVQVKGTYNIPDLGAVGGFDWEIKLDSKGEVYEYNIP